MVKILSFLLATTLSAASQTWQSAAPGHPYTFPQDHGQHPDFKTEWWYFTGQLKSADNHEFGYEITWFRQGVNPNPPPNSSRFITRDFKFAHFALSDISAQKFNFSQKISRGSYNEAGFGTGAQGQLAWIDNWHLDIDKDNHWIINATDNGRQLHLTLTPEKSPVIEGENGISQKAAGDGHASCYYSYTRMRATGALTLPNSSNSIPVTGETWFDHEWATNQLTADQAGWDWFSVQLSNGAELMLYRMRLKNGQPDTASSGTFTDKDGKVTYLKAPDFKLTPDGYWKSTVTKGNYPIRWQIDIARLNLSLEISTPLKDQELALPGITYWEGLIHATGSAGSVPITGHGYLELTGYGSILTGI